MKTSFTASAGLVCFLFICADLSFGEDIRLANGKVLKNAKVTKVEPDGLKIVHEDGVGKVPAELLPDELRAKYSFDPQKAKAFRKKTEEEQIEAAKRLRKEREAVAEFQIAPIKAAREQFEKTPRLTEASSIKGLWQRSLPWPHGMETPTNLKYCQTVAAQIQSGFFDLEAEMTALRWNRQEYERVGDSADAQVMADRMDLVRADMDRRNAERREAEFQQRQLALEAAQAASAQRMADALDEIAFRIMSGEKVFLKCW
jgi:hypothetical protein